MFYLNSRLQFKMMGECETSVWLFQRDHKTVSKWVKLYMVHNKRSRHIIIDRGTCSPHTTPHKSIYNKVEPSPIAQKLTSLFLKNWRLCRSHDTCFGEIAIYLLYIIKMTLMALFVGKNVMKKKTNQHT